MSVGNRVVNPKPELTFALNVVHEANPYPDHSRSVTYQGPILTIHCLANDLESINAIETPSTWRNRLADRDWNLEDILNSQEEVFESPSIFECT